MKPMPIIRVYSSPNSGPTTTLMAGVHGNETTGLAALSTVEKSLVVDAGTVIIIFANPEAINQGIRYIEKNMNRCFLSGTIGSTYEELCVQKIIPYLNQSDYLLDLHNTLGEQTSPFLISEHKDRNFYFNVPYCVSGLDVLEKGGSDGYMNSIGKVGLCLECGSVYDGQIEFAQNSIFNFLKATGNILGTPKRYPQQTSIKCETIYITQTNQFKLTKNRKEFESVAKGTIIAYDGKDPVIAEENGCVLFARNRHLAGEEGFIFAKKE